MSHILPAADAILSREPEENGCDGPSRSHSPFYSNIGISMGDDGANTIQLHYNRVTQPLGAPAIHCDTVRRPRPHVTQIDAGGFQLAFFARDSFLVTAQGAIDLRFLQDEKLRLISVDADEVEHLHTMVRTLDPRDPDEEFPLLISTRVLSGERTGTRITGENIRVAVTFQFLTLDKARAEHVLMHAPAEISGAHQRTEAWLREACGDLTFHASSEKELETLARATHALLFNSAEPPGLMEGRIASFPSRGGYPTHFLWDACFHMLALEEMDDRLCRDALCILTDTIRSDGMIAHFVCSTWIRPRASQPPLVGWAAERYIARTGDVALAAELLPKLTANCEWWLTQRLNRFGLISCLDPFETGWDDTPRLDNGPIVATDMSAYVLMQMRSCVRLAKLLDQQGLAAHWQKRADDFAQELVDVCWDNDKKLFHDVLLETGQKTPQVSPALFLPLLGDVPLPEKDIIASIRTHLFDPNTLFGPIPFPSIAHDDPEYSPTTMWRGPMWPPINWLLLEMLEKFDLLEEKQQLARRFYDQMLQEGNLAEYYNSQDGAGLGYAPQGWTSAIFLRLHLDLTSQVASPKIPVPAQ